MKVSKIIIISFKPKTLLSKTLFVNNDILTSVDLNFTDKT